MTTKLQATDIPGMQTFESAKSELVRHSELLLTTTNVFAFLMRLSSIKSLIFLLEEYSLNLEEVKDE